MSQQSDSALVLRKSPYGETSLVVHVLTRASGRVELLGKGAHRPRSRFAGVLDWFDTLALTWTSRPRHELQVLDSGDLEQRRQAIPRVLDCYRAAQVMLELAEFVTRPGQVEAGLFECLEDGLGSLEGRARERLAGGLPGVEIQAAVDLCLIEFELVFLQNLGLPPALGSCAACGGAAPPVSREGAEARVAFSAGAGGRLCQACAAEARARGRRVGTLPERVVESARALHNQLQEGDAPRSSPVTDLTPDLLLRIRDLLERFLDFHLEARPKTLRRFLDAPNRNAPLPASP